MNGDKCQKKMMGRGVEGGCGTEEKPLCNISRAPTVERPVEIEIGYYDQAKKALTERCPFDSEEVVNVSRVSTLPVGLADFLAKHTASSRKRQKKTGGAGDSASQHQHQHKKKHSSSSSSSSSSNIWADTQDYFRPLGLNDIELLFQKSSFASSATTHSCFTIPAAPPPHNVLEAASKQPMEMEIDAAQANVSPPQPTLPPSPQRPTGLEWLLGSTSKILLTSERPSKKRKLLGSDAGLDRLRVVCPSQGHPSPVCHVCCSGDLPDRSNQLLVCDSCRVFVHQRCYGVQDFSVGPWLCSWCKHCRETGTELYSTPCCLCPSSGGALKPVAKDTAERKSTVSGSFVHLFCSQWMPEVYVEDTRKMEPIMNISEIKDTRKKLVCNICKVKYGACLRCTHGTCRTSFHPICAREARHRMEIWGKIGSEAVELRAFCSKHSDFQDIYTPESNSYSSIPAARDSAVLKNVPANMLMNKPHKIKLGHKNGDNRMILVPTSDAVSNKPGNNEVSWEQDTSVPISNTMSELECNDAQLSVNQGTLVEGNKKKTTEGNSNGSINLSDSLDCVHVLKKLVDCGEVGLRDVASEIDISCDTLAGILVGDQPSVSTDLHTKMVKWLRNHAYMGNSQTGRSSANLFGATLVGHSTEAVEVEGCSNSNTDPVKLLLPENLTNNIGSTTDNNVVCSSKRTDVHVKDKAMEMGENVPLLIPNADSKEHENGNRPLYPKGSFSYKDKDGKEKVFSKPSGNEDMDSSIELSVQPKVEPVNGSLSENGQANAGDDSVLSGHTNSKREHSVSSVDAVPRAGHSLFSPESPSCSYIHPFVQKRLMGLASGALVNQENNILDLKGFNKIDSSSIFSNDKVCMDLNHTSSASQLEQLAEAKTGVLDLSPEDEVEGELIYYQNKLIDHAVTSRHYCDDLIFRVIKALPQELDAERKQRWDSVLVNQYMCGIREAKKQGRKERRHKEAQAVLAAATAAAAASSRISSFRKDSQDEVAQELAAPGGRTATHSQLVPRAKETLSRLAVPRVSSAKPSDVFQLRSFLSEHQQLCDICRRSETMLNPIFVCCNCKVAVHFGCYRGVRDHIGPWYCEHCEELLPFRSPRSLPVQCGLCGASTGAFRKSTDGQWIHAFCAEWLLESTYRRGQPNLVEGMENILKGRDVCYICSRKVGLCIKCNYGNCQSIFHPYCARNAGFYMIVRTSGGKLQHKAYCDRHSLEQREKAEAQLHGPEELKAVKQIRVELERVRLLCERIIKREKVKRELVICSHSILASKRDSVAFSVLVRSPFFLPDASSESATTSLRGHVDDNKSCSEAMQRSEDVTVDSAISANHRVTLPVPMETDQKTDDSSTSQQLDIRKPHDRPLFSGKQLPHRPASFASWNPSDDEEKRKLRKNTETFQKELVMTSDQASVQNQRLPKGFAYVPIVCLPKEKPVPCERSSEESVEPDG